MTKEEFIQKLPAIIDHKSWGRAKLEILCDDEGMKGAGYRDSENCSCGANFDPTWSELYSKMLIFLTSELVEKVPISAN